MCVIRRTTYIHSDGRQEIREAVHRCRLAPRGTLCANVERRDVELARVVEVTPSTGIPPSPSRATTSGPRYYPLSRRASKRTSNYKAPAQSTSNRSSLERSRPPPFPSSTHRTAMPPAPSPPPFSARPPGKVSFNEPHESIRTLGPDGTAFYAMPPNLTMPRAAVNERPSLDRNPSISSLTNEVDDTEAPKRKSSLKRPRGPSGLGVPLDSNMPSPVSSPGLSNLPRIGRSRQDSASDLPLPEVRARTSQEEDERQARILREAIQATNSRQRDRLSRDSGYHGSPETSRERMERHRRKMAAALAGQQTEDLEAEMEQLRKRRLAAEMAQVEREKLMAEERRREERQPPYDPVSGRACTTSRLLPPRPLPSARVMTDLSGPSPDARIPRYGNVKVHHYGSERYDDPLGKRGEQVISSAQNRTAGPSSRRIDQDVAGMNIQDRFEDDDELDSAIDSGLSRAESKRYRKEQRRRRREQGYND